MNERSIVGNSCRQHIEFANRWTVGTINSGQNPKIACSSTFTYTTDDWHPGWPFSTLCCCSCPPPSLMPWRIRSWWMPWNKPTTSGHTRWDGGNSRVGGDHVRQKEISMQCSDEKEAAVHPRKLTWNLKTMVSRKKESPFPGVYFRCYVKLLGE